MEEVELVLGKLEQKLDIIFDSLLALQEDIKLKDKLIMELKYSLAARDKKIEEIEHRIALTSPYAYNISNICRLLH